jgi:hypothetical protein
MLGAYARGKRYFRGVANAKTKAAASELHAKCSNDKDQPDSMLGPRTIGHVAKSNIAANPAPFANRRNEYKATIAQANMTRNNIPTK